MGCWERPAHCLSGSEFEPASPGFNPISESPDNSYVRNRSRKNISRFIVRFTCFSCQPVKPESLLPYPQLRAEAEGQPHTQDFLHIFLAEGADLPDFPHSVQKGGAVDVQSLGGPGSAEPLLQVLV